MVITLTQSQFTELQKIISVIASALSQGNRTGEISNAINSAEWNVNDEDEVKITLA